MLAEFLVGKPENHVENLGVDNTKMNVRKYCWRGVEWIRVAECREQWVTCEDGNVQFYTVVRMMYQIWSYLFCGHFYSKKCFVD
jgi:hypothetical protein